MEVCLERRKDHRQSDSSEKRGIFTDGCETRNGQLIPPRWLTCIDCCGLKGQHVCVCVYL